MNRAAAGKENMPVITYSAARIFAERRFAEAASSPRSAREAMLNINRLRSGLLSVMSPPSLQEREGILLVGKDHDVLDQSHHLEDVAMGFFHIGETQNAAVFQALLDHAGKDGDADGVDVLYVRKIDDERAHALA